jgi:hypothetical protein
MGPGQQAEFRIALHALLSPQIAELSQYVPQQFSKRLKSKPPRLKLVAF